MNRKPLKKPSLNAQGSQENVPFSLPSINNIESKKTAQKEIGNYNPNNYNFINVDFQKKMTGLFSSSLSESEKALVEEMFIKIEEQRKEIDQRNSTLLAIQRNFESLSLLCKNEKANNQELQRKVAGYSEENAILIDKLKALQEKNKGLVDDLTLKDKEIACLKDKSDKNSIFLEKIRRLEEEQDKKAKSLTQNQKEMLDLSSENKGLKEKIKDLEKKAANLNVSLEEIRREFALKSLEIGEKNILLDSLKDDLKEISREKADLEQKSLDFESKIPLLSDEIRSKSSEIFQLREKCRKFEEKESVFIQTKLNGEEVFRQENERLRRIIRDRDEEIKKLDEKIGVFEKNQREIQSQIQGLKEKHSQIIEEKASLESKLKEREQMNQLLEGKMAELEGANKNLQREKSQLMEECNGLRRKLAEIESAYITLQREIKGKASFESKKNDELLKLKEKCDYFQKKSIETNEKLQEKDKEIGLIKAECSRLLIELSDLSKERDILLGEKENYGSERGNLLRQIHELNQENQALLMENKRTISEKEIIQSELINRNNEKDLLSSENAKLAKNYEQIQKLEANLKEKEMVLKENARILVEKDAQVQKNEASVRQLTKENRILNEKIEELEAMIKKLNPEKLEQLKKSIEMRENSLKNVIAKLENSEESLIANLSCTYCLELLNKPIICFPCGHSFCEKCKMAYEGVCFECKRGNEPKIFRNRLFEEILTKIQYIKTTTDALKVPLYHSLKI